MANVPHCPNCDRIMVRGSSVVGGTAMECPLHAAAPILLEALEAVVEAEFGFGAWPEESVLRAAIAQAKGETANG